MPFTTRSFRRFPVQCPVKYNSESASGVGTVLDLSGEGCRIGGNLSMEVGQRLSMTVQFPPSERLLHVPEAVVRWSHGEVFGIKITEIPTVRTEWFHQLRIYVQEPLI